MFRCGKYEFSSKEQAEKKIDALGETHKHTIVKIGNIAKEQALLDDDGDVIKDAIVSDKYAVDVLWQELDKHPKGWKTYAVDIDGNGVHVFSGIDYQSNKI